jgi:hypothetical protein
VLIGGIIGGSVLTALKPEYLSSPGESYSSSCASAFSGLHYLRHSVSWLFFMFSENPLSKRCCIVL